MSTKKMLFIIILVASTLRLFWLTSSPPALNWDEVSIGYNAYSILKTGRDEWGNLLPLSFKAFGEHKLPGMIYASIPGIAIFGLTEFGVRITPAIIGILTVLAMYYLGKQLASKRIGLISAALLAISPWHVHLSRASFEAGLALLFLILALRFFSLSLKKPRYLTHTTLLSIAAIYSYNSARIVIPLLFISYLFIFKKQLLGARRELTRSIILALILLLPIAISLVSSSTLVRWDTLSITNNESFYDSIGESRRYTPLPSIFPRLIHNKYSHHLHRIYTNYISTFSSEFLFFKGGTQTQRSTQDMGLMYIFELPLLLIGIFSLKRKKSLYLLLLPLIFISPIPSAITVDAPSTLRSLSLLPALIILVAIGFDQSLSWIRERSLLIKSLLLIFVLWNIIYFAYRLFGAYPIKYSSDWQWGYKEAITQTLSHYDSVDNIYFTSSAGEPYIYILFYGKVDPRYYQTTRVDRVTDPTGWVHVMSFDKYIFTDFVGQGVAENIITQNPDKDLLLVTGFAQLPSDVDRTFAIQAPNWKVLFEASLIQGNTTKR